MRTPTIVCLSAFASAAIAVPTALVAHDFVEQANTGHSTIFSLPGTGSSSGNASSNGAGAGSSNSGGADGSAIASGSGTTARATSAQETGVVMIETVLPGGEGAGSGMVLSSDGTILTNYHVVNGSTTIRVKVPQGGTYTADVVGHDQTHDVAVLKLRDASGLKTVSLDTDGVKTAESVLAVGQGNGQGVLYAATGVITGTDASITARDDSALASSESLTGLLKTNAPIVPGYSGGPLFDRDGKVVGIDTAASSTNSLAGYDSSSGSTTEGFAIPIKQAKNIADDILAGKKTTTNHLGTRASLGIKVLPSSSNAQGQQPGQESTQGVMVDGVVAGQAAAQAGLAAGDVITSVGGQTIANSSDLSHVMDAKYPGERVTLSWTSSDGTTHQKVITLSKSSAN